MKALIPLMTAAASVTSPWGLAAVLVVLAFIAWLVLRR